MAHATTVLEDADVYTIEWDEGLDVPVFSWDEYAAGEKFRESARQWESVMEQRGVEKYMVNTEAVTAHEEADKRWLAETWVSDLVDIGVRRGAGVFADSAIASMDMEEVEESMSSAHPDYEFRVFPNTEEARAWLRDQ